MKAEVKAEDAAGPSSAGGTPPKTKKPKKAPPRLYEPCGRGPYCTCAICRKAHEQQVGAGAVRCCSSCGWVCACLQRVAGKKNGRVAAVRAG